MKKFAFAILLLVLIVVPVMGFAQNASGDPCTPNYTGTRLCNGFAFLGASVTDIPSFISAALAWLASIIGTIALVMVIFSGARMIFSRGEPDQVKSAKASFAYSIYGLLLVMFAYVIISALEYFLGTRTNLDAQGNPGRQTFFMNPLTNTNLMSFVQTTITTFLSIVGTAALLYIIIGAFRYVMAGGNEEQAKSARANITWAIYGLVSIILSYLIVRLTINTFA